MVTLTLWRRKTDLLLP